VLHGNLTVVRRRTFLMLTYRSAQARERGCCCAYAAPLSVICRSVLTVLACASLLSLPARAQAKVPPGRFSFALSGQFGEVFTVGVVNSQPGPNYGLGLGADYEWRHARLGGTMFFGGGGTWGTFGFRADAAWLPFDGAWTPYFGAGAGLLGIGEKRPDRDPNEHFIWPNYMDPEPLVSLQAGAELMRDREIRLLAGGQLDMPLNHPFECNASLTSCGNVWKLSYPVISFVTRIVF
jgi:hypothetical protein